MKIALAISRRLDGAVWRYRAPASRHPMHRHAELELNLVVGGEAAYLVRGRRYQLRRRSMIWLFPGQEHVLLDQSGDLEMWIVVFRPRLLARCCHAGAARVLRRRDPDGVFCRVLAADPADRLAHLISTGEAPYRAGSTVLANAALAHVLLAAWSAFADAREALGTSVHPAVQRAADLLQAAADPLSVPAVARAAGLSPSRLSHLFSAQTGLTLAAYRNRQRIERFLQRRDALADENLLSAAFAAGFGSYAQFHRVFKKIVGCSPRAYRRRVT